MIRSNRFLSVVVLFLLLVPVCVFPREGRQLVPAKPEHRTAPFKPEPSPAALEWANSELARMSLDEKVGQLISVGINATFLNQDSEPYQLLRHYIEDDKVGGVILFRGPV